MKELPGTNNQKQKFEIEKRKLFCYKCGKEIIADKNAQAVICKYCYQRNDLSDHKLKTIFGAVIQTHGQLYLQKKGIIATSTIQVGNAVIRGKVIGDITAQGSVEILKKGEVRGNITCRSLIVRKGGIFVGYLYLQNTDGEHISTERIREQHQTVKH
ncbi:MAG: polymer-forming cytoskeletal protein [Victivallales bacterium]|nr:polymer-forming cytoskeletal protein [Victivallales bacterium]